MFDPEPSVFSDYTYRFFIYIDLFVDIVGIFKRSATASTGSVEFDSYARGESMTYIRYLILARNKNAL